MKKIHTEGFLPLSSNELGCIVVARHEIALSLPTPGVVLSKLEKISFFFLIQSWRF